MSFGSDVRGSETPRLWTPPLRELTPETSYGFDVIDFAQEIGWPLDPWEQAAVIRGGELLPDGRPRFRFVLVIVARQNGKTLLCRVLVLYWMFIECHELILGTSTGRDTAKQSWREVIRMAEGVGMLADEMPPVHTREQLSEEDFWNSHDSHYRFAAPNRRAGRGSTLRRLILDELREHRNRDTYDAAVNAGNAVADFQAWAITNQGDATSVVLDELRDSALEYIETGQGDPRLGLLEWSAPNGADPTDPQALAMANPNLGHRIDIDALMGQALTAKRAGGETLARFRTEILCQRVTLLDPAVDEDAWLAAGVDEAPDLAEHRSKLVLCLDVSLDGSHATLVAAARVQERIHVEVVQVWQGYGCTKTLRQQLPGIVERVKPRALGWFPSGPAAAVAADLAARKGTRAWPPRRVRVAELTAEVPAVCMGLAEQVLSGEVAHPRDDLLTSHVKATQKLNRGDGWVFTRRGGSPIDATYALAGAVHLARTLPAALPPLEVA
jgi:hypothetical protein